MLAEQQRGIGALAQQCAAQRDVAAAARELQRAIQQRRGLGGIAGRQEVVGQQPDDSGLVLGDAAFEGQHRQAAVEQIADLDRPVGRRDLGQHLVDEVDDRFVARGQRECAVALLGRLARQPQRHATADQDRQRHRGARGHDGAMAAHELAEPVRQAVGLRAHRRALEMPLDVVEQLGHGAVTLLGPVLERAVEDRIEIAVQPRLQRRVRDLAAGERHVEIDEGRGQRRRHAALSWRAAACQSVARTGARRGRRRRPRSTARRRGSARAPRIRA